MALLDASKLAPEAQREQNLDDAFSGTKAAIVGFKPCRRVTALVVDILRRANNFFITGAAGFKSIGIDPKKFHLILSPKSAEFDPTKAGAIVPKIAEVIALLTCEDSEMDACDDDITHLAKLRRRVMNEKTMAEIMEAMADVQAEFAKINRSTAVVENDDGPAVDGDAKKKRDPASAPVTS